MSQVVLTGRETRLLTIFGQPVSHSLSPVMHNEAFRHQKMNCFYTAAALEPDQVQTAVAGLRALGYLGANVTHPYKEAVMPYLDEVAPTALQIGAVNTIVNRAGRLIGYNTDGWGLICSLEEARVRISGRHVVILGAGGAARSIAFYLARAGVASLVISNRTLERAQGLVDDLRAAFPDQSIAAVTALSDDERQALINATLVINCTPLGMAHMGKQTPLSDINLLPQDAVVYDTVYGVSDTRLLREARLRGLRALDGLGMLVHQGACAWEYWFGRRGPVTVMRAAALDALEGQA